MEFTWNNAILVVAPAAAFFLAVSSVPLVRSLAIRCGCVALPKKERWHTRPTAMLGGVAFFPAFVAAALVLSPDAVAIVPFFTVAAQMFALGLYDDLRHINPAMKLAGQIIAGCTAVFFGYSLHFFSWQPLDALVTVLWIVGVTNALNLLDNMDGLAGGIALIAAVYLSILFSHRGDAQHALLALAMAGAAAGFLFYNFYPASIFMGDAGSLSLGSSLALLTLHVNGQASNIVSLLAVPTCILLVPILDTGLVTVTRLLRGRAISRGGRDHSSHRLVVLGLSEPQTVLLLYFMASVAGGTAVLIERFSYSLSLALLPWVLIAFTLFTAYLAQVEIVSDDDDARDAHNRLTVVLTRLTYKRRLLEVLLDLFVIASAYYLAFALRFEFALNESLLGLFMQSAPIVIAASYLAFFFCGMYRGLWRYTGLDDLVRIAQAVTCATLLSVAALIFAYRFAGYSRGVFVVYGLLLFFGASGTRLSFRLFGLYLGRKRKEKIPVLIYGAGDGGEIVLRECRRNSRVRYRPVGFLDDDPHKQGRTVLGLRVFGGAEKLREIVQREKVAGCIISSPKILANGRTDQFKLTCRSQGIWIKQLRLEFADENTGSADSERPFRHAMALSPRGS